MIPEDKFVGNDKTRQYLEKILKKGRISHAYLFEGPQHVGKTTLALHFAANLLGDTFESVLKNPDLIFISVLDGENQISADAVREMQKNLSLYPYKSPYKVAIIEQAECMNTTAANSLLKTLEEPGKTSILILISSDTGKMLDTIKSRCQIMHFSTASKEALRKLLHSKGDGREPGEIIDYAYGKPGMGILMLENKEMLKNIRDEKKKVLELFSMNNLQKIEEASRISALEKNDAAYVLDIWTAALRDELTASLQNEEKERTAKLKDAIEKVISVKGEILNNNVNLKLAIENLCFSF